MVSPKQRGNATKRGYGYRWQRARIRFLQDHPLCVMCKRENRVTAASIVDHIVPHKGDETLFWDEANWQPLCKPHHDSEKRREEHGNARPITGADGWPV